MQDKQTTFRTELEVLINRHSMENGSNTPDFLLAGYLAEQLETWDRYVTKREKWYGRGPGEKLNLLENPNAG